MRPQPHKFQFFDDSFSLCTPNLTSFFLVSHLQQVHLYGTLYRALSGVTSPLHRHCLSPPTEPFYNVMAPFYPRVPSVGEFQDGLRRFCGHATMTTDIGQCPGLWSQSLRLGLETYQRLVSVSSREKLSTSRSRPFTSRAQDQFSAKLCRPQYTV